jgi:hypothetical protein
MRRVAWILALPLATAAHAAELSADFRGPGRTEITLAAGVDDEHLADPPGYFAPKEPIARVVKRITVENTGTSPIENPSIYLNGRPLLPVDDPIAMLGVSDARDLTAIFSAWRDRVIHATTDLDSNRDPSALLTVFGAAYCGDDARALAAIDTAQQGEARFARLNGHSVAEHRSGAGWVLLDGDQNLYYLDWDNRTPVGEAEILADPLLALRTQVFGRQSSWQPSAAWQNTSRFEFIDKTREQKNFRLKNAPPKRNWTLLPGEKIVINFTRTPDLAIAASAGLRANPALRAAACEVEFYPRRNDSEKITLPFPLSAAGEPVYDATSSESAIICQAARAQFPMLRSGVNVAESKSRGDLRVSFDAQPVDLKSTPVPTVRIDLPHIHVDAKDADRVWWQISADENFRIIAPNLDRVSDYDPDFILAPIDESFISPGRNFARAKVRRNGVWSDWSESVSFEVKKPAQPLITGSEGADGDQMRIRWEPAQGEMLVFGSNRLDFLPEIYGDQEAVRVENGAIRESRPNKNLLATVPAKDGEAYVPIRACYRLVARNGNALSVPSRLLRGENFPATVLQNRHEKPNLALPDRDVATEMEIP